MGLGDQFSHDDEEQSESNDGSSKTAYIYIESGSSSEAYDLMSTSLGGDAALREWFKRLPDEIAENQHDFIAQFLVALDPVRTDDDYSDLLEFLMVDADNIWDYMEDNPEVGREIEQRITNPDAEAETVEADD